MHQAQALVIESLRAITNTTNTKKIEAIRSKHPRDNTILEIGINRKPQ